jgi:hypothetical protein
LIRAIVYMFIIGATLPLICISVDFYKLAPGDPPVIDEKCYTIENDTNLLQADGKQHVDNFKSTFNQYRVDPTTGQLLAPVDISQNITININNFQQSPFQSAGGKTIFIPKKTLAELLSFVNNPPAGVIRFSCCNKQCI